MKTLELGKEAKGEKPDRRTLEAQIALWYKPPALKTVLTEELATAIAECFLDGFTDEETAEMCFVDPMTLKNWRNLSVIRNHERQRKKFYIHEIRDGKRRDWTRLAWWLERRYPLEFSRPEVAHAISTSIHTTVNTTQNLIVSSELAEQLAERNARVSTKIEELFANRSSNRQVSVSSLEESALSTSGSSNTLPNEQHVKDIVTSITSIEDVTISPNGPPLLDPGVVTPSVLAGASTDHLSPTPLQKTNPAPQKTKYLGRKAVKALLQIPEDIKNSGGLSDDFLRKRFDKGLKKITGLPVSAKIKNVGKTQSLELEGQVIKTKIQSKVAPEDRPAMEREIQRASRETKLDRAKLRAANKKADKLHPRKAHP